MRAVDPSPPSLSLLSRRFSASLLLGSGVASKAHVRAAAKKASAGAEGEDAKTWLCIPVPKSKKRVNGVRKRAAVDAQEALATDVVVQEEEEVPGEEAIAVPNPASGVDNGTIPTADYNNAEWSSDSDDARPAVAVGVSPLAGDEIDNDNASDVLVDAEPGSEDDADRTAVADASVVDEKRRTDESSSGHSILPGGRATVDGRRKQTLFF